MELITGENPALTHILALGLHKNQIKWNKIKINEQGKEGKGNKTLIKIFLYKRKVKNLDKKNPVAAL